MHCMSELAGAPPPPSEQSAASAWATQQAGLSTCRAAARQRPECVAVRTVLLGHRLQLSSPPLPWPGVPACKVAAIPRAPCTIGSACATRKCAVNRYGCLRLRDHDRRRTGTPDLAASTDECQRRGGSQQCVALTGSPRQSLSSCLVCTVGPCPASFTRASLIATANTPAATKN